MCSWPRGAESFLLLGFWPSDRHARFPSRFECSFQLYVSGGRIGLGRRGLQGSGKFGAQTICSNGTRQRGRYLNVSKMKHKCSKAFAKLLFPAVFVSRRRILVLPRTAFHTRHRNCHHMKRLCRNLDTPSQSKPVQESFAAVA
jgi:hypothetical protein